MTVPIRKSAIRGKGFTLLEVLVSMAILSLGMIAIFSGMSQSLDVTIRLRDKTLASWVGTNRITEMQVTGDVPSSGSQRDEVEMAGTVWVYQLTIVPIPDLEMRRVDILVSYADTPNDTLATVTGFISAAPATTNQGNPASGNPPAGAQQDQNPLAGGGFGSGWEPPTEQFGEIQ